MTSKFGHLGREKTTDLTQRRRTFLQSFPAHLRREAERIVNAAGLEQNDLYVDLITLAAAVTSRLDRLTRRLAAAVLFGASIMVISTIVLLRRPHQVTEYRDTIYTALPGRMTINDTNKANIKALRIPESDILQERRFDGFRILFFSEKRPQ